MECVRNLRKEKNMTCRNMAEAIGVSRSLYEKAEYGDKIPGRKFMEKFKRTFPSFDMNIFFEELLHISCNKLDKKKSAPRRGANASRITKF